MADRSRLRPGAGASEEIFWRGVGVSWRHLAGDIRGQGFSFEWHEADPTTVLDWSRSFHSNSVEICLNLEGAGSVWTDGMRAEYAKDTTGFFAMNGGVLQAQRLAGQSHRFLSVEFALPFLHQHLGRECIHLNPSLRSCLTSDRPTTAVSEVTPITRRQRELLRALLHPPVLRAAQALWYHGKALEFAAEFFYVSDQETLCSRAQRVAQERVAKAKAVLAANLEESLSLEELGRRVGCSPYYLSRTFSQETGMTLSQWLRAIRLERAAELLRSRKCNVTEAALQVGYSSLSHFSLAFRETYGCCPGLYPMQTPSQRLGA